MSEQEKEKGDEKAEQPKDTDKGDKPETNDPIERANQVLQGIKEENDRTEKLLHQRKELIARDIMGGKADAGTVHKTKEETEVQAMDKHAQKIIDEFYT